METSGKMTLDELFSTDIDVIHRNIELGTHIDIDADFVLTMNQKIHAIIDAENPKVLLAQFDDTCNNLYDKNLTDIAKYLNIYYIDDEIDYYLNKKNLVMEEDSEFVNWIYGNYKAFYYIKKYNYTTA